MDSISSFYASRLDKAGISKSISSHKYAYNSFDNGVPIKHFQRRIYRRLIAEGYNFGDPFNTQAPSSLFNLLKSNNLLSKPESKNMDKMNEVNMEDFQRKLSYIYVVARLVKRLIGIDRYALLCKFAQRFVRPENQTFLIKETKNQIPFYNENRYINWE